MKTNNIIAAFMLSVLMTTAAYCAGQQKKVKQAPVPKTDWIFIPGGRFTMGTEDFFDAKPPHMVTIRTFQMSRAPVTVEQYSVCFGKGRCTVPDSTGNCNWGKPGRQNYPINCVDWEQANQYAIFMDARLPSESEWEYAATSGGLDQKYPWGNEVPTIDLAVLNTSGTVPVCSKPKGNTVQGLCDMSGNIGQWVRDVYKDTYDGSPDDGSAYKGVCSVRGGAGTCHARMIRGGNFSITDSRLRVDNRNTSGPDVRSDRTGFRLAK